MGAFTVYFEDKSVVFCGSAIENDCDTVIFPSEGFLTPANLLKILENNNKVCVVCEFPDREFERFSEQFIAVEAAGGVVADDKGRILMMFRRGWWDLPKGHVEPGETAEEAALREVAEETGLSGVKPEGLITSTHHFYNTYGKWEMKLTRWYRMHYGGTEEPVPQAEEGIAHVRWFEAGELEQALHGSYSTIRSVIEAYNTGTG